jgi:hypothetical protein
MRLVDLTPDRSLDGGELLRDVIVEEAVSLLPPKEKESPWQPSPLSPKVEKLMRLLEMDGFTVVEGALRPVLPADVELPAAEDEITRLLNKHSFSTPQGHLKQAFDAFAHGSWASANGQLRTCFEALLDEIALKLDATAASISSGHQRRLKLAALGFLSKDLNEWNENGGGFINGLVKRLHPQGAHPGLSDQTDSVFRLHLVLLTAQLMLTRFDTWPTP